MKPKSVQQPIQIQFFILIFLLFTNAIIADNNNTSPYFKVLSDENETARLPLKSTEVDVTISGVIADVHVKQIYTNAGTSDIEAIYVFPASTRAAVYYMEMKVGDRIIKAQIQEKSSARKKYENAKKEGRIASLLEEETPNVFKMNIANIIPGATVEVNLYYTELLIPTDKIYEFVYPTVVGPRYVSKLAATEEDKGNWTGNPYLNEGELPTSTLELAVKLNTGVPIQEISCATHKNRIDYLSTNSASVSLNERFGGNRDFVLKYRLAGNAIETGVLLYEDPEGENYFLAMLQPPARINTNEIPPREYVFIIDVSGSMSGFPLEVSRQLMTDLLSNLRSSDLFNIVFFAGGSDIYSKESLPASKENIEKALAYVKRYNARGGTELIQALKTALNLETNENYARSFVILTDGFVDVEKETFELIRENLGNANIFAFGVGSSVNRHLIEGMAHVGYGEPFFALNKSDANQQVKNFITYVSQPALTNIICEYKNFEAYDILPEKIPDLFAERPIIIAGKYSGNTEGEITIVGNTGENILSKSVKISGTNTSNIAIKYLWAREKIKLLGDYNSLCVNSWQSTQNANPLKEEITALGLKYSLLTEYTSFIAIDSIITNKGGKQETINQALPLPQGVSNNAIGDAPGLMHLTLEDVEINELDESEASESEVFMVVEDMPKFPGGDSALANYLIKNINYPEEALRNKMEGKVFVSFVIDETGNITDVMVVRGVNPLLDAEAVRVVSNMPKWIPGKQRGRYVKVKYNLPINFVLSKTKAGEKS